MASQNSNRKRLDPRAVWSDRLTQAVLAIFLWWAVEWQVARSYGLGSGIVAATCAAWGFVLLSTWAGHMLDQRAAGPNGQGPRPPSGRWPGAPS